MKGNVTLREYTDEGLDDPEVLAMAERVSYVYDDEIASRRKEEPPKVEIRTKSGATVYRQDSVIYGMPEKPVAGSRSHK